MNARRRFDIREASAKIFLVLAALLAANVAVSVLYVRPMVVRYRQLTDQSSPQRQVVAKRETEVVQKESYRGSLEKVRDDMKHLAADVLSTRQRRMIGVQLEIAKLVREFGIAGNRVKYENPSGDEKSAALERFGIMVPLTGGYTNLRKFIQAVESSDNFLVIERVNLGTGKSNDVVELNITLATYFISPEANLDELGKAPHLQQEILMARSLTRRELGLLSCAGLAALIWLWYAWGTAEPQAAAAVAKKAEGKRELAMGKPPVVHLDLLDKSLVRYDPGGRDLFKYSVRPPSWGEVKKMRAAAAAAAKAQKEAEERLRIAELERQKREEEARIYALAHPQPPPPPQPPAISFKFLGFVGPPTARIAAFEENDTTFVAKAGEVVKKEFRIDEIKYESVVISYVNPQFKGQVRELPLLSGK